MNQYPERQVSRQCWKTYKDGRELPLRYDGRKRRRGRGYRRRSPELRLLHRISECVPGPWDGSVLRRAAGRSTGRRHTEDSTGFLGFGRNTVTASSIFSDTVWGLALPEIWCNSGGNPLFAFLATALMVGRRDEFGYADSLGILGAGPLRGFTPPMVVQNGDG